MPLEANNSKKTVFKPESKPSDRESKGCKLCPNCFDCPFPDCVECIPDGFNRIELARRDKAIYSFRMKGVSKKRIIKKFGISSRSYHRIIQTYKQNGGKPPKELEGYV